RYRLGQAGPQGVGTHLEPGAGSRRCAGKRRGEVHAGSFTRGWSRGIGLMINGGTYEFSDQGVHAGQGVLQGGTPLEEASVVLVLAHGRGASADDMIGLGRALYEPGVAVLAPQASGSVWYPERFLAPIERNEPWLSSALGRIDAVVRQALDAGIPTSGIIVGGFSQGACLATEYAARQAGLRGPLGGVLGFSGGLIGPPGTDFTYPGSLEGMPVFLGCSDV